MIVADMVIGYKMFREKFTSRVKLSTPDRIDVIYEDGPFRYLNNHWIFLPQEDGSCVVDFYVDFEFRSKLLQKMIGVVFNEAVKIMVHAFEKRATAVYAE
jgi:coenzyme Q-binding protein COQ10